jgi:hypothetical protein
VEEEAGWLETFDKFEDMTLAFVAENEKFFRFSKTAEEGESTVIAVTVGGLVWDE